MAIEDDQEAAGVAHDAEPAGVVAALGHVQTGRIEKLHLAGRLLLRVKQIGEPLEPLIEDLGFGELFLLTSTWIGGDARQPLEDRALAGARETCNTDFHENLVPKPEFESFAGIVSISAPARRAATVRERSTPQPGNRNRSLSGRGS